MFTPCNFGSNLRKLSDNHEGAILKACKNYNIRPVELRFLKALGTMPPKITRDIARINGVSQQSVGKITKGLNEKGYIKLSKNHNDHREKIITLTSKGFNLIGQIKEIESRLSEKYSEILGDDTEEVYKMIQFMVDHPITL